MSVQKPKNPKGTRDFLPTQMARRNYIFDNIKSVFRKFGFVQIETPSFEMRETLTGKYGEEGDRLIFKILNSGDKLAKADTDAHADRNWARFGNSISEKALRYDLTVPFARFFVQHQNDLQLPFKRFQIQPVWRADRPQKGRYQEFYQCDVDVIGSDALLYEVELVQIADEVLDNLNIQDYALKINNRKILQGITEVCGISDQFTDFTIAIDKLDKVGIEGVKKELVNRNIADSATEKALVFFEFEGDLKSKLEFLKQNLVDSEVGMKGVEELEEMFGYLNYGEDLIHNNLELDITLARGLNYYTGAIFEIKANNVSIGSILGGGRYDDLTGLFGLKNMSGVGISFGADRIYDVLEELDLFPKSINRSTDVLFVNFGNEMLPKIIELSAKLRKQGVNVEVYPKAAKMNKQFNYADKKSIPTVLIMGEEELKTETISIKNMDSGEQQTVSWNELMNQNFSN